MNGCMGVWVEDGPLDEMLGGGFDGWHRFFGEGGKGIN